jgi:nitroreductase
MTTTELTFTDGGLDRADMLDALLRARFSCRGFRAEPVSRPTIERVLALAQRTPSWCNSQPWQVSIVSGPSIERLRALLPAHALANKPEPDFPWPAEYRGVYNQRRRDCGLQLYEAVGIPRGDKTAADQQRMQNFTFFGAPHVAVVTTDGPLGIYGAIDCGAYINSFTLAARACGVATIAQAAVAAYPSFWRTHLGLPADRPVVCGISFGFEDGGHPANQFRTTRAATCDVVTWVDGP